jgi:hypothetical protein
MPFMVGNDRIGVGVEDVDADHKKMVEMINELYDAILAGSGRKKLDAFSTGWWITHTTTSPTKRSCLPAPVIRTPPHTDTNMTKWLSV